MDSHRLHREKGGADKRPSERQPETRSDRYKTHRLQHLVVSDRLPTEYCIFVDKDILDPVK